MKLNKKSVNKKGVTAAIIAALILMLTGIYTIYHYQTQQTHHQPTPTTPSESEPNHYINYSEPTENDISENQDAKKNLIQQDKETTASEVQVGIANHYISSDSVEIRAFTPSIVEGGGICTAVLTQSDARITGESEAFVDASTSQCRPIIIPLSNFPSRGSWKLQVNYKSNKYYGTSPTMEIKL